MSGGKLEVGRVLLIPDRKSFMERTDEVRFGDVMVRRETFFRNCVAGGTEILDGLA